MTLQRIGLMISFQTVRVTSFFTGQMSSSYWLDRDQQGFCRAGAGCPRELGMALAKRAMIIDHKNVDVCH